MRDNVYLYIIASESSIVLSFTQLQIYSRLFFFFVFCFVHLSSLPKHLLPLTFLLCRFLLLWSWPVSRGGDHLASSREQPVAASSSSKRHKDTPNKGIATRDKCATQEPRGWPMNLGSPTCSPRQGNLAIIANCSWQRIAANSLFSG